LKGALLELAIAARRLSMRQKESRALWILAAALWWLPGCSETEKQTPPPSATAPAPAASPAAAPVSPAAEPSANAGAEADRIFSERCATCHGPNGGGDGPASAGLVPKPRNFQDAAWQKSVSDEYLAQIIQYGGAAVGKSAAMPPNPDLMSKPEVVAALAAHVRSLAK
jgi:mono/diheme cytochrome c family protein